MLPNLSGLRAGGLGGCGRRCAPVGVNLTEPAEESTAFCTLCTGAMRFESIEDIEFEPYPFELLDTRLVEMVELAQRPIPETLKPAERQARKEYNETALRRWTWDTAVLADGWRYHRRCLVEFYKGEQALVDEALKKKFVHDLNETRSAKSNKREPVLWIPTRPLDVYARCPHSEVITTGRMVPDPNHQGNMINSINLSDGFKPTAVYSTPPSEQDKHDLRFDTTDPQLSLGRVYGDNEIIHDGQTVAHATNREQERFDAAIAAVNRYKAEQQRKADRVRAEADERAGREAEAARAAAEEARAAAEAEQAAGRAAQEDAAQQAAEAAAARQQAERTKAALKKREVALDQRDAREAAARAEMDAALERREREVAARDAELQRLRAEAEAQTERAIRETAELERRRAEFDRAQFLASGGPMRGILEKAQAQRFASPEYVAAVRRLRDKNPTMDEEGFAEAMRQQLLVAVHKGDVGFVRAAILDGANPEYAVSIPRSEGGAPKLAAPLWDAASSGNLPMVQAIVEMSGMDVDVDWVPVETAEGNWSEWQKEAPAYARAALNGHVDVVRYLMGQRAPRREHPRPGGWLAFVEEQWMAGAGTQDEGVRFEVKLLLSPASEAIRAFYNLALAIKPTEGELQTLDSLGMTAKNFNVAVRDHVLLLPQTLQYMKVNVATAKVGQVDRALEYQSLNWASTARKETDVPDAITLSIFRQLGVDVNFMHLLPETEDPSKWPWITMLRAAVINVLPERAKALIHAGADPNLEIRQPIWRGAVKIIQNRFRNRLSVEQQDLIQQVHMSPLMLAFQKPDTPQAADLLNVLYDAGADPAFVTHHKMTFSDIATSMRIKTWTKEPALANARVAQLLQKGSPSDRSFGKELLAKAENATAALEKLKQEHGDDLLMYAMTTPLHEMVLHPVLWVHHARANWLYPFGQEQWQLSGQAIAQTIFEVIETKVHRLGLARSNPEAVMVEERDELRRLFQDFNVNPNFHIQLDASSDISLQEATQDALTHTSGRTHATTLLGSAAMLPHTPVAINHMIVELLLDPSVGADPNWSPVPLEQDSMFPVDFIPPLAMATLMNRPELHDLLLKRRASPELITRWTYEESTKKMHPLVMWNGMMRVRQTITREDFEARLQATRAAVPPEAMAYGDAILARAKAMKDKAMLPYVVEQLSITPWMDRELWEEYLYSLLWETASKSSPDGKMFLERVVAARQLDLESSMPNGSLPPSPSLLAKLAERGATPAMEYVLKQWDGKVDYTPDPSEADGPLLSAVKAGAIGAVKLLLDNGADRDVKDKEGRSPLQLARRLKDEVLVRMLDDGAGSSRNSSSRRPGRAKQRR